MGYLGFVYNQPSSEILEVEKEMLVESDVVEISTEADAN